MPATFVICRPCDSSGTPPLRIYGKVAPFPATCGQPGTMCSAITGNYTHWRIEQDSDDILWLTCDRAGHSTNALSEALISELGAILTRAATMRLTGLVLQSGKPGSFILGADIREFDAYTEAAQVTSRIRQGHAVFSQLENLPIHKVAIVEGFCLGGGLELALTCDYIAALNVDAARPG